MSSLKDLLGSKRNDVVKDLSALVETTVANQSGFSGMALKGAVGAATKIDKEIVSKGMNRMLPEMIDELEPHWQDFRQSNSDDFALFLAPRTKEVVASILTVADKNAEKINVPALKKAYDSLRGKASSFIEPAIPEIGHLLAKHMA